VEEGDEAHRVPRRVNVDAELEVGDHGERAEGLVVGLGGGRTRGLVAVVVGPEGPQERRADARPLVRGAQEARELGRVQARLEGSEPDDRLAEGRLVRAPLDAPRAARRRRRVTAAAVEERARAVDEEAERGDLCGIPTDSRYLQLECSGTNFWGLSL